MADALKALEIVEGLDEFKNQSPEKTMTSTRRKPSKEENQATQSTIRTSKTTRKVSETPVTATNTSRRVLKAEPEIKDETPLQSCRGRAGVGSRRKVEAQKESSLQTGYVTRRSVRLPGKSMSGLSLKENERVEPVKDDEMVEGEVGNNNGQSGDTSELPLVRNLSSSLEDEREKNDDVEGKCESNNEKNDEPEGEDKFADGIIDSKGSDAIAVSEDTYEIDDVAVSKEGYEIENLEEEMVVEKSNEVLFANAEASADMEAIDAVSVEEHANQAPQEIECQKSLGEDCEINAVHDDLTLFPKAEEYADDQVSQNVSVLPEGHMDSLAEKRNEESDDDDSFLGDSDFDDDMGSDSKSLADAQEEVSFEQKSICIPTAAYSSEGPMTSVNEEALVDDDEDDTGNEESDDDDENLGDLDIDNEDPMANIVYEEALLDANVTELGTIPVSTFHNTSQSVVDNGDSEALIDVCVKPAEEFAETAVANSEMITTSVSSMSSPLKAQLSQPRKSSSKKQTTIPKVTQVLENINKENIDNHSVKKELDLGLKKVKKNKNLEDLSLRNLKKLITEQLNKLEIADKNKEDDTLNKQPFGKRSALQTLPQNSMNSEEKEKLN